MWRNTGANATAEGEWTNGDPSMGVPRSILEAPWLNMMQRELINLVEGAGLTLDQEDESQVLQAVLALAGGIAGSYLLKALNLGDLTNKPQARTNLDVYSKGEAIVSGWEGGNQFIHFPGVLYRMGSGGAAQEGESFGGTIEFPTAPYQFQSVPRVFLTVEEFQPNSTGIIVLENVGISSFTWRITDRDTSGSDSLSSFNWLAIGPSNPTL